MKSNSNHNHNHGHQQQQSSSRHYNQRQAYNNNINPTPSPLVAPLPGVGSSSGSSVVGVGIQQASVTPHQQQQQQQHPGQGQSHQHQQPHLYSRNNSHHFLSQPADMPPVETVVARLETACRLLHGIGMNNTRIAEISSEIQILSEDLRRVGPHLEMSYPDVLDRVMSSMRDASAQPCLPPHLRLAIFELVELRASKWLLPNDSSNYYRQRRSGQDDDDSSEASPTIPNQSPKLANVTTSTPQTQLEKQESKTYREEILIKNSDSGKVMGVRGRRVHIIEALSDTIISFEKVGSSAKERVLSINGYSQQSINMAKSLIHETINRNSSPVFDASSAAIVAGIDKSKIEHLSGSAAASTTGSDGEVESVMTKLESLIGSGAGGDAKDLTCQFNYTVAIGEDIIKVSGNNFQMVQEAKLALDDFFSCKYNLYSGIELDEIEASARDGVDGDDSASSELEPKGILQHQSVDNHKLAAAPRLRYTREELLLISSNLVPIVKPSFAHLDQVIQDAIVLKAPKRTGQQTQQQPQQNQQQSKKQTP